jgi:hypothetical protein
MNTVTALLIDAENNHIFIDTTAPENIESTIINLGGYALVGISAKVCESNAETSRCLAHELGHYHTGTLYNLDSPELIKEKCEYKADVWMVTHLMPIEDLKKAISDGYTETWQLADYFNVPECVVLRAAYIYKCKELL